MHTKAINDIKTISAIIRAAIITVLLSHITYNSVSFGLSILLIAPIINCICYQIPQIDLKNKFISIAFNAWYMVVTITFGIVYQSYNNTAPLNKNNKEISFLFPFLILYIIFFLSEQTLTLWYKDLFTTTDKVLP